MIKIQEHLNRVDAEIYLDQLAESHWTELNPPLAFKKGLKKKGLIEKCKKYSKEALLKRYLKDYALNDNIAWQRQKDFFNFLTKNKCYELKRIVISKPADFAAIEADIFNILVPTDLYTGVRGNYSQTLFGKLLSEIIFNYSAFRSSAFCKTLFTKIGFGSTSCPYCNLNKVSIVNVNDHSSPQTKLKAYLDLDHFYPKLLHPFFAVSFFNLVPTCHDCNSSDKGDKPFTIETNIHPYYEAFEDFYKFKISLTALLGDPIDDIKIEKLPLKPADRTLVDLNLVNRYIKLLPQVEALVKYFLNYNHLIGSPDEAVFTEAIFTLNSGIPKNRKDILKIAGGKISRDTLMQIDIHNILNLT